MKIRDLKKILPSIRTDDIEVDTMEVIESHFFDLPSNEDYRKRAIDFVLKEKKSFNTTCNCVYKFAVAYVQVVCPKCGKYLVGSSGSGTTNRHSVGYRCEKCKVTVTITTPSDGYAVSFDSDDE
jgi:predicted RNA-binding Zn-ribbon protein involved in translation (DUF1610 family)